MIPIIVRVSINRSMEWMGVPYFHRIDGPTWTANLLALYSSWVDGGSTTNPNCGSQPGEPSWSIAIPWNCPVRVLPVYCCRISENTRAASMTITFEAIVWRAYVVPVPAATSSVIDGRIGGMMIGRFQLINNVSGEFLLVVSVSVTILLFPSLGWVSTDGSLFGSLYASSSSEL